MEEAISQLRLFAVFLKAGNLTFGGGDPTMAVLQREFCQRRKWLAPEQFALAFSLARITPGTNMMAFCVAVAYLMLGWTAAILASVAVSAPAGVLAVWITIFFEQARHNPVAGMAVNAITAAVLGAMCAAALALLRPHLHSGSALRAAAICGGALLLRVVFDVGPVTIMSGAALLGCFWKDPA